MRRGAEELGVDFDEHVVRVIAAMEERADELGLEGKGEAASLSQAIPSPSASSRSGSLPMESKSVSEMSLQSTSPWSVGTHAPL